MWPKVQDDRKAAGPATDLVAPAGAKSHGFSMLKRKESDETE